MYVAIGLNLESKWFPYFQLFTCYMFYYCFWEDLTAQVHIVLTLSDVTSKFRTVAMFVTIDLVFNVEFRNVYLRTKFYILAPRADQLSLSRLIQDRHVVGLHSTKKLQYQKICIF